MAAVADTPLAPILPVTVLLVDDQIMVGEAIRRALVQERDVVYHFCPNPDDAVSEAQRLKPTVILQDLVLPRVDGLTLVRAYRDTPTLRDVPIIVLSTKEDPITKSAAFAAGANDYLVKLPDAIELIARIRYHSRSYLALRERDEAYRALHASQQQLLEMNLELRRLSNLDGLTGLANRRYFDEYLGAEWQRAMREQRDIALMMVDVDHFKRYNDTYGHLAGDGALKQVAQALQGAADRSTDLAARYGGEEFSLVMPNTSLGGARLIGEKLRRAVAALAVEHKASTTGDILSVSIGAATMVPQQGTTFTALVDAADRNLYAAKHQGRNQVVAS
ncbi:diguanylate cyclase domain-containing protein [Schauerella aestuarii]|uniref:diguanylate cyclase domain-containing protein n=1 Tax=Schauerella aestuarii TaxID=2511204 RepID=UPI00136A0DFF|nr:diguanylate cyclase [Achromobacter aestuarii]MYZ44534.1 diguanylate cyclase [Achromobacter aestuarii]